MTVELKTSQQPKTTTALAPWLVAAGAFIAYALTLNHWVTLRALPWISPVTGWDWRPIATDWRPNYFAPLWSLTTLPCHLLPIAWRPVALNLFSAVCASLTLALLSASVRLLPHDRTREQRQREPGEFSLLSGHWAFVPQIFAVLVLGLGTAFWQNAVSASNEMLDLLVFAFLIYCLLRFRVSQNERWLRVLALVYGLGVTNNFALIGFFPLFLAALIWIKGIHFFNVRFMVRLFLLGIVGLLLYLYVPLIGSLGSDAQSFGGLLLREIKQQYFLLRVIPRWIPLVASLSSIVPLICAGFHWPEVEGELSAIGFALTKITFMAMNVLFLPVSLLIFFNWRFSTDPRAHDAPTAFLTFYYVAALAVGYYSGYILVVFGKRALTRGKLNPPLSLRRAMLGFLVILLAAAPAGLGYYTAGAIRGNNDGVLARFTDETMGALPSRPAVVLSDDPIRLQLLEAGYARAGKADPNILLETSSLPYKSYLAHLIDKYPEIKKGVKEFDKLPDVLPDSLLVGFINDLSRQFPVYYLHPSFGYYFEHFYLRPHHLVYQMLPYAASAPSFLPPHVDDAEVRDNQEFWRKARQGSLAALPQAAEDDWDAARVGVDYSVALDFWGVELQRANQLPDAHAAFTEACRVNTNNVMARFNLQYNEQLQRGDRRPITNSEAMSRAVNNYGVVPIIKYDGPPDEPGLCMTFGLLLEEGGNLRQATALFERRLQLLPDDPFAKLSIAKTLADTGQPAHALALTRQIRSQGAAIPDDLFWVEAVAYLDQTNFPQAERAVLEGQQQEPDNIPRLVNVLTFYRSTGLAALRAKDTANGKARLERALAWCDQLTNVVAKSKGSAKIAPSDVLMFKADLQVSLQNWDAALQTFNHIIENNEDNPDALLNRAIVLTRLKKFPAAKDDAEALRRALPRQPFVADFQLAEIAKAEQDLAGEKKYLHQYLKTAPSSAPQYAGAKDELKKLEKH